MRTKVTGVLFLVVGVAVLAGLSCTRPAPPEKDQPAKESVAPVRETAAPVKNETPADMARIPAGCFEMGDAFKEGVINEVPVHKVCITKDFYLDIHEVTNGKYQACVDGKGCTPPGSVKSRSREKYYGDPAYDNFPVINVDWNQATAYCQWAGKRLPSEAEWEYGARGGLAGKRYPWGDEITCADANYERTDPTAHCFDHGGLDNDTQPVGTYPANGYGLCDMAGNVWEWVHDGYSETYYSESPQNDPPGLEPEYPVVRGGSFGPANYLRVAYRGNYIPTLQVNIFGFRCARD